MIRDNILLITDSEEVSENILAKLVLLRKSDSIAVCNYTSAKKILNNSAISIVIIDEMKSKSKTLNFIQSIKSNKYEIILLVKEAVQEFILAAYDIGISDYIVLNSNSYEMLIRTVNSFKLKALKTNYDRNTKLLQQLGAIDETTNFYNYKFCKEVLNKFIKEKEFQNGIFSIISVDDEYKDNFSTEKLSEAIKNSVRSDDIVTIVKGGKFYLIFPNIDLTGATAVIDKIQNKLGTEIKIHAGITKITEESNLINLEKNAYSGLSKANLTNEMTGVSGNYYTDSDEWLEEEQTKNKNYKIFQNAFNNKLENVITPIFFRFQKAYEEKLFETKIIQFTNELQSIFQLKCTDHESNFKITYPGYAKIYIYITHSGLNSPENREIEINLKNLNSKYLSEILEEFINEYKTTLD